MSSCVVRVKNRFSEKHDPMQTGGYRNVSFILKLTYPDPQAAGNTKSFLCELQVDIAAFADLKHRLGGHKRYVLFRNGIGR